MGADTFTLGTEFEEGGVGDGLRVDWSMRMLGELTGCGGGLFLGETTTLEALVSSILGGRESYSAALAAKDSDLLYWTVFTSTACRVVCEGKEATTVGAVLTFLR